MPCPIRSTFARRDAGALPLHAAKARCVRSRPVRRRRSFWRIPEREPRVKRFLEDFFRAPCPDCPRFALHCYLPGEPGTVPGAFEDSKPGHSAAARGRRPCSCRVLSPLVGHGLACGLSQPFLSLAAAPYASLRDAACLAAVGPVSPPGTDEVLRPSRRARRLNHRAALSGPQPVARPAARRVHPPNQADAAPGAAGQGPAPTGRRCHHR